MRRDQLLLITECGGVLCNTSEAHEALTAHAHHLITTHVMTLCPPPSPHASPFFIGQTQVTQALWAAVMGENPSAFKGAQRPVERVSWGACVVFVNALSRRLGLTPAYDKGDNDAQLVKGASGFRLPLASEWLWAAQGGEAFKYAGSDQLTEVGWCVDNAGDETHEVAQLKPNGYGLYDMSGNVWEWCADDSDEPGQHRPSAEERVDRGGSYQNCAQSCALTYLSSYPHDCVSPLLGLRLFRPSSHH